MPRVTVCRPLHGREHAALSQLPHLCITQSCSHGRTLHAQQRATRLQLMCHSCAPGARKRGKPRTKKVVENATCAYASADPDAPDPGVAAPAPICERDRCLRWRVRPGERDGRP